MFKFLKLIPQQEAMQHCFVTINKMHKHRHTPRFVFLHVASGSRFTRVLPLQNPSKCDALRAPRQPPAVVNEF